ncbi:unnamed protein product [Cylicocyclus nassatus]|uniref:Serpentine receptor class gamma n=1 Tax=Cylicocyclus nassatus TaxID=53992 RepID=A0AA36GDB5_CYLNA|nr:unnamed protein product [Cylicocyclus nassatus]
MLPVAQIAQEEGPSKLMGDLTVDAAQTSFMCILYIALGFTSIICNSLNLWIWLSNRDLRRKYLYLMALDAGEFVNGISYVLCGSGRGLGLITGRLSQPITVRQCYFNMYWPHSLILGTELPSFGIILIACERLCAVLRPAAYKRIFMGQTKYFLLAIIPTGGIISTIVGGLSALGREGDVLVKTQHCAIINSTAIWYSTFHFVFIVLAYVISFISIFIVWRISQKFTRGKVGGENRLGIMLMITGSSIFLVGSESIVMIFIKWGVYAFPDLVVALTYAMPGFLSLFNTTINFIFRSEFRNQFFRLINVKDPLANSSNSKGHVWVQPLPSKFTFTITHPSHPIKTQMTAA